MIGPGRFIALTCGFDMSVGRRLHCAVGWIEERKSVERMRKCAVFCCAWIGVFARGAVAEEKKELSQVWVGGRFFERR